MKICENVYKLHEERQKREQALTTLIQASQAEYEATCNQAKQRWEAQVLPMYAEVRALADGLEQLLHQARQEQWRHSRILAVVGTCRYDLICAEVKYGQIKQLADQEFLRTTNSALAKHVENITCARDRYEEARRRETAKTS